MTLTHNDKKKLYSQIMQSVSQHLNNAVNESYDWTAKLRFIQNQTEDFVAIGDALLEDAKNENLLDNAEYPAILSHTRFMHGMF